MHWTPTGASKEADKRKFFELAGKLQTSDNASEQRQIKEELARIIFGVALR